MNVLSFLQDNPFASGLVFTTGMAAVLAYLRNIPKKAWNYFWRQFSVTAEIRSTDPAFNWLAMWLDKQPYSKKTRNIAIQTYHKSEEDDSSDYYDEAPSRRKRSRPDILFTPAQGSHIFWYDGRLVWLSRGKSEPSGGSQGLSVMQENFNLCVMGRKQALIRKIINDAMMLALPDGDPETFVIPSAEGRWQSPLKRKPRSRTSVILDGGHLDKLIDDARKFLRNKAWYEELGIPYRRGYLFHGVPGSGKTSAALAIAGELGLDVYVLNLGDRYLDDSRLNYMLAQVPQGSIVLLEDIDAAFNQEVKNVEPAEEVQKRTKASKNRNMDSASITFSGLLNALDGVAAREGRLLIMSTNHKDILDPALIRPGRADLHIEFGYATAIQAEQMFMRFFPQCDQQIAMQFGHIMPKDTIAMAAIQDHLLKHKDDPNAALTAWATINQRD